MKKNVSGIINDTKTGNRKNKIAYGLVSLMQEKGIKADLCFDVTYSKLFLDMHMLWYQ